MGPEVTSKGKPILDIVSHNFLDTRYGCDNFDHFNYGNLCYVYSLSKKLRESRKDNMTKEKMKQTINTIKHLDSMKAVKVAFDLSESNQDSINKVMQIVGGNVNNINQLAGEIAKIKKILARFQMTEGLDERSTN